MTLAETLMVLAAWFAVVFMVWVYFDQKKRQSRRDLLQGSYNSMMLHLLALKVDAADLRTAINAALEQYELRKRRPNHKRKSFTPGDAG
jgi:hypothetical protein